MDGATHANPFDITWIHDSTNRGQNADPSFQVLRFDRDTFVLRQNKSHSFEAPFVYLVFGAAKALLLDTGALRDDGIIASGLFRPISEIVDELIGDWSHETGI